MNAYLDGFTGHPTCRHVLTAPKHPAEWRDRGLAMLKRYNMIRPDAICVAIDRIQRAPFLTRRQKRPIPHDNAARFLRIEG